MTDYSAAAIAPAFWKVAARPGFPAVIERVMPGPAEEVARYDVQVEAEITPSLEALGRGLFKVTTSYVASDGTKATHRYVLVSGRFALLAVSDGLGAALEGAMACTP